MGKIIAFANQKGGVGKTTSVINLASSFATLEKRTLIVDVDPQANSTSAFGYNVNEIQNCIYDCLIDDMDPNEVVLKTQMDNLDIIPSHIDLVGAEIEMLNMPDREHVMQGILNKISDQYDYIVIDCSPSLGLITINALTAAHSVIIPVQCEYFALEGISKLLNTIKLVQNRLNTELEIEGFLLTMYDARLRLSNQVVDEVKRHFEHMVFNTIIQRNIKLSESPSFGLPAILYDAESKGAISYLNLAKEILQNNDQTKIKNKEKVVE